MLIVLLQTSNHHIIYSFKAKTTKHGNKEKTLTLLVLRSFSTFYCIVTQLVYYFTPSNQQLT